MSKRLVRSGSKVDARIILAEMNINGADKNVQATMEAAIYTNKN